MRRIETLWKFVNIYKKKINFLLAVIRHVINCFFLKKTHNLPYCTFFKNFPILSIVHSYMECILKISKIFNYPNLSVPLYKISKISSKIYQS